MLFPFAASVGAQSTESRDATAQGTPEAAPPPRTEAPGNWGFRWKDHPTLQLGARTQIEFRARVQTHISESEAPIGSTRSFDLSRRRLGVEGQILGVVQFQVEREIEDDDPWRDVYVNFRRFDAVQVQAGKFKLPFSLDEGTSATNLDFVYRSRGATQLAPGRDRGLMVHGRTVHRMLGYQVGVFDHDGANARTKNPERVFGNRTVAGRVTIQPFRSTKMVLRDLQLGAAATYSEVPEGLTALRGRTALDAPLYLPDLWVQGARRRAGLELRWRPGPFSVKSEYARVTTERREQSVDDSDLSNLIATAWYVSGTYLFTGERKATGPDVPRRPLLHGGFGAVEVAGRIENLAFGSLASGDTPSISPRADVVFRNGDRAATLGVNWYPIRRVKLQANLIHETIADPFRSPLPAKPGFWSRVFRFQITI
jgi:phosphate-selective porin